MFPKKQHLNLKINNESFMVVFYSLNIIKNNYTIITTYFTVGTQHDIWRYSNMRYGGSFYKIKLVL